MRLMFGWLICLTVFRIQLAIRWPCEAVRMSRFLDDSGDQTHRMTHGIGVQEGLSAVVDVG
ncbi:MAG: hypothetical protein CMJ78_20900 [Planctomycetaceae bacterium]|nr:hypothetical protein [Planctomycetaceae bacterium]